MADPGAGEHADLLELLELSVQISAWERQMAAVLTSGRLRELGGPDAHQALENAAQALRACVTKARQHRTVPAVWDETQELDWGEMPGDGDDQGPPWGGEPG